MKKKIKILRLALSPTDKFYVQWVVFFTLQNRRERFWSLASVNSHLVSVHADLRDSVGSVLDHRDEARISLNKTSCNPFTGEGLQFVENTSAIKQSTTKWGMAVLTILVFCTLGVLISSWTTVTEVHHNEPTVIIIIWGTTKKKLDTMSLSLQKFF